MDIPTSTSTVINCTKSEFAFYLGKAFAPVTALSPDQFSELSEVVDGLVRQANEHHGTFTGYNAYLDCQFTVTPDEGTDTTIVQTVTRLPERDESRKMAFAVANRAAQELAGIVERGSVSEQALVRVIDKLLISLGHLTISEL